MSLQRKTAHFLPPLSSPVKVNRLQTQWGGGFDGGHRGVWEGSGWVTTSPPIPVSVRVRKITPSEDNYVTPSLNNRPQNGSNPNEFDWQAPCEPLYKRREVRAAVTVAPQVLQTVDVVSQSGLYAFYARRLQEIPLLIHLIIGLFFKFSTDFLLFLFYCCRIFDCIYK